MGDGCSLPWIIFPRSCCWYGASQSVYSVGSLSVACIFKSFKGGRGLFDASSFTTFILLFLFVCLFVLEYHFSKEEERLRVGWLKIFECFWVVFKGIFYKMIMFPRSAPSGILSWILPHTSYNIPEGDALPYGLGWHQLDDVLQKIEDQLSSPRVKFASWSAGSLDLKVLLF